MLQGTLGSTLSSHKEGKVSLDENKPIRHFINVAIIIGLGSGRWQNSGL